MPANERGLGMVFQSYAIWPHMTVFDNVAFPLQVRNRSQRPPKQEIEERVRPRPRDDGARASTPIARRPSCPAASSSGWRWPARWSSSHRCCCWTSRCRTSTRSCGSRLRYELKRLQRELGITSIYVTHDQIEALALSTQIAVMQAGTIVQLGRPREVYENPGSKFVAEFIGTSNFIPGTVGARDGAENCIESTAGRLYLDAGVEVGAGEEVVLSIRPEAVELSTTSNPGARNEWRGTVVTRAFLGDAVDHVVEVGKHEIRARVNPATSIEPGTEVYLRFDPAKISLVPIA